MFVLFLESTGLNVNVAAYSFTYRAETPVTTFSPIFPIIQWVVYDADIVTNVRHI